MTGVKPQMKAIECLVYYYLQNLDEQFIKEKLEQIEGPPTSDGRQTKPGAARSFNFI